MSIPSTTERPRVGATIGDPCGIGPEVIAKAWATGEVHRYCRPVLVGCAEAMRSAVEVCRLPLKVRTVGSPTEILDSPGTIDIIDSGALDPREITIGKDNAACGRASAVWLDEVNGLALKGALSATVMGPISTGAMKMAGVLDKVVNIQPGESYLFLVSGPLRVMHLTDHISVRRVCELVSEDLVLKALHDLDAALKRWGVQKGRIVVAGLNPHAMGEEEKQHIAPAIARARAAGIDVEGPTSPDTVFRQCIEGRYDVVLAMFHDQGHIAIKTWGFSGNSAIVLGPPYLHLSVAHGTAYDIAGRGIADPAMMINTLKLAGSLSGGSGFLPPEKHQS